MKLTKEKSGEVLIVKVQGRLDTNTAVEFGTQINDELENIKELNIDLADVDYISSLGLRAILELQKTMNAQGKMRLFNVQDSLMNIFEMTGFTKILTIE